MPGARCTRSLVCKMENTRVSHHRFTGSPGTPCAVVLTVSFVLSLMTGLCCHHRRADTSAQLDASVGASGPHDFAVRSLVARPHGIAARRRCRVHRIPNPTFVTIAKRPSIGNGMARDKPVIWVKWKGRYFCKQGWTRRPAKSPVGQIRR